MDENWKEVVGFEGLYEVSDLGRVRSLVQRNRRKPGILTPGDNGWGYLVVNLYKDGKRKAMKVHRLVAEAFLPNPLNLETVNHRDENKTNNSASNLEWMRNKDNVTYSQARPVQMFDKSTNELLATFPSTMEASRQTGIYQGNICRCCRGKLKSTGGFVWKYVSPCGS